MFIDYKQDSNEEVDVVMKSIQDPDKEQSWMRSALTNKNRQQQKIKNHGGKKAAQKLSCDFCLILFCCYDNIP